MGLPHVDVLRESNDDLRQRLAEVTERLEQCETALLKARILLISEGDPDEDSEMIAEIDELLGNAARAALEGPKLSSEVIMVTDPLYDPWRGEK